MLGSLYLGISGLFLKDSTTSRRIDTMLTAYRKLSGAARLRPRMPAIKIWSARSPQLYASVAPLGLCFPLTPALLRF
jgi:hypothetical protein